MDWLTTDHWVSVVLIVGVLIAGASIVAHVLGAVASEVLRATMSAGGDRDEELMEQAENAS